AGSVLGLQEEHGHLIAPNGATRTIVAAAAASGDPFGEELLDPVGEGARAGDVGDETRAWRRHIASAVLRLQQQHGQLLAADGVVAAEISSAAAGGDPVAEELLDEFVEDVTLRHVAEVRQPPGRKCDHRGWD